MNKYEDDFIVVIRSAGERTVKVCEKLIREEIGEKAEFITIECSPFEEAIKKSYKIGIESGKKWLVTVDADVLIRKGGITDLLKIGETLPKNVFQYEGFLYDGLLLKYRQGGVKVYRANLLAEAIKRIPEPGTQIRPETYTQDEMSKAGYSRKRVEIVTGIHDYEQFHKDVYRKCYVHAIKHQNDTLNLLPKWNTLAQKDIYYKVALKGAFDGLKSNKKVELNVSFFNEKYNTALKNFNFSERDKLTFNSISFSFISSLIDGVEKFKFPNRKEKFYQFYKKNGSLTTFRWSVAKFLKLIGRTIYPEQTYL